jgi:hypothetical protein
VTARVRPGGGANAIELCIAARCRVAHVEQGTAQAGWFVAWRASDLHERLPSVLERAALVRLTQI